MVPGSTVPLELSLESGHLIQEVPQDFIPEDDHLDTEQHRLESIICDRPLPSTSTNSQEVAGGGEESSSSSRPEIVAERSRDSLTEFCDFCRICHENTFEEDNPVKRLGCDCKLNLGHAHVPCAEDWFGRRRSNVCEVCHGTITMELESLKRQEEEDKSTAVVVINEPLASPSEAWPTHEVSVEDQEREDREQNEASTRLRRTTAAVQIMFVLAVILLIHRSVNQANEDGFKIRFVFTLFILVVLMGVARASVRIWALNSPQQAQQIISRMWAVYTVSATTVLLTWVIILNQE